jgi:hypothetical protein
LVLGIERTTSGVRSYLAQNKAGEIGLLVQGMLFFVRVSSGVLDRLFDPGRRTIHEITK